MSAHVFGTLPCTLLSGGSRRIRLQGNYGRIGHEVNLSVVASSPDEVECPVA
jgi:hypothetical protein